MTICSLIACRNRIPENSKHNAKLRSPGPRPCASTIDTTKNPSTACSGLHVTNGYLRCYGSTWSVGAPLKEHEGAVLTLFRV